jgi:hypothetical protein
MQARLLRAEPFHTSLKAFEGVVRANAGVLAVTGFAALMSWLFFSVAMYVQHQFCPLESVHLRHHTR